MPVRDQQHFTGHRRREADERQDVCSANNMCISVFWSKSTVRVRFGVLPLKITPDLHPHCRSQASCHPYVPGTASAKSRQSGCFDLLFIRTAPRINHILLIGQSTRYLNSDHVRREASQAEHVNRRRLGSYPAR